MITGKKIRLRHRILTDSEDNYSWHTDPELAKLDAAPLLSATFAQYLSGYLSELRYPSPARCAFAIETLNGKHIGNCSYYDINKTKGETELGVMIGNRNYWDKGYGSDAVTTLLNYIFQKTDLKRVYLKTLDSNRRAQTCFKKCGFAPYGHMNRDGYNFVLMEIHRKQWEEQTET